MEAVVVTADFALDGYTVESFGADEQSAFVDGVADSTEGVSADAVTITDFRRDAYSPLRTNLQTPLPAVPPRPGDTSSVASRFC